MAEQDQVEKQLWCCVIQLAWDDLFSPKPGWRQGVNDWERNKREARLFLTKATGEWAQSRRDVCIAAGVDPVDLREAALREERRLANGQT